MNKQIEEMAKDIYEQKSCDTSFEENCKLLAYDLVTLGYQKVDKDKQVVLTKEEYEKLKQLPQKIIKSKDDIKNKFKTELKKLSNLMFNEIDGAFWDGVNEGTDKARKETAEKFIGLRKYITQQFHNYHEARDKAEAEYKKCKEEIGKAVLNNDWHRADAIMFILEQISIEFDRIIESLKQ